MLVKTRYFGEVELDESKLLTFEKGLIGFENLHTFTIIYNNENGEESSIEWLQSVEEPSLALPVINPNTLVPDYSAEVDDEIIAPLGEMGADNVCILVTMTVPADITKMSINLKAPIIINSDTRKGCQVITESDYPVKFNVYDVIKKNKEEKGE